MSDDLRLNSVERFVKQSKRLILEEHSSCEVPAGCGGVVLRWSNPDDGLNVTVHVAQLGETELFCGGELRSNARFSLQFGEGVLALHVTERESKFDWLRVVTRHHSPTWRGSDQRIMDELCTADDGTWLGSTRVPAENWTECGFDDANWQPLRASTMSLETIPERDQWRFRIGADPLVALALPQGKELWIRKGYTLDMEG